ncbi:MAG: hemerythrin domain-containing protein [Polyangiaceae bacterium]
MGTIGNNMTGGDVVTFLKAQHEQVRTLFQLVFETSGDERASAFHALRRTLAVHETAEEEIVHPAARQALPDGDIVVAMRLAEERAAKEMLVELESIDLDTEAFERGLVSLEQAILTHSDAEEVTEFDRLANELDPTRLERMQRAVEFAETIAPTRPHPGIESRAANLFVGPFASMIDRARDAIQRVK